MFFPLKSSNVVIHLSYHSLSFGFGIQVQVPCLIVSDETRHTHTGRSHLHLHTQGRVWLAHERTLETAGDVSNVCSSRTYYTWQLVWSHEHVRSPKARPRVVIFYYEGRVTRLNWCSWYPLHSPPPCCAMWSCLGGNFIKIKLMVIIIIMLKQEDTVLEVLKLTFLQWLSGLHIWTEPDEKRKRNLNSVRVLKWLAESCTLCLSAVGGDRSDVHFHKCNFNLKPELSKSKCACIIC